jgi:PBSX family phage terminase large subunit
MNLTAATALLSPKQIRSIGESSQARISIWTGAVRSGKTIASLIAFLVAVATAGDQGLIVIVGRTLQTIERNILDPLQDWALFGFVAGHIHHTRGATTAVILGRVIHLIGASDARAEGRIRGATIQIAYVDEATLVPESFWIQLLARLSVPGARLLATTNPDGPAHWLRKRFLLRAGELNLRYWHFTIDDNPGLPEAYIADLKKEYQGLWYRRFILGEWCLAEGAIFDMFDERRHVVSDLPPIKRWIAAGVDHGSTNPFAAVLLGLGVDGLLYAVNEYRFSAKDELVSKADTDYADDITTWLQGVTIPHTQVKGINPELVIIDPAAKPFRTVMERRKFPVMKGNNAVVDGLRTVSSLLALDALKIHDSCTGLLNEIPGYSWDEKAAEKGEDKPIKADDHSIDALRYAIHTTRSTWRYLLRADLQLAA